MKFASFRCIAAPAAFAFIAILSMAQGGAALAGAASSSPWVASTDSKVRLVSGTVDLDGSPTLVAGVQLRMEPGWKTYWRNPGDSGVPPSFDFRGSKNLKQAVLLYPAPHRIADANGTAIGYDDEVVFPVKITPEREGEPVEIKLAFEYGLCKDLCIPNEVNLDLVLSPDAGRGDAVLLENALVNLRFPAFDRQFHPFAQHFGSFLNLRILIRRQGLGVIEESADECTFPMIHMSHDHDGKSMFFFKHRYLLFTLKA